MQGQEEIINDLKNNKFYPFYLLHGTESHFIDRISDYFKNNIINDEAKNFDLTIAYGKETSISKIIEYAKRYPLISKYQLIIIKEAHGLKKEYDPLIKYLDNPQKSSIIVFCYKNKDFDKRSKLYKSALKNGMIFHSNKLKENQAIEWISNQINTFELSANIKSVHLIHEFLGNNLDRIYQELNKLKIILKDKTINEDIVEKYIGINKDYNNFELINAIGKRDKNKCLKIINYISNNSKTFPLVLTISMVFQFFKRLLMFHGISNSQNISQTLGINPFFLKDYKNASLNYNMKSCSRAIEIVYYADLKSKGIHSNENISKHILVDLINEIFEL